MLTPGMNSGRSMASRMRRGRPSSRIDSAARSPRIGVASADDQCDADVVRNAWSDERGAKSSPTMQKSIVPLPRLSTD